MSEIFLKNVNALIVSEVEAGSSAARAGVCKGDLLRQINGSPILDILDYRFHAGATRLKLSLEREGQSLSLTLRKGQEEDAGLSFEFDLGDKVHTCKNKCVFCFIHQQPKKMRKSLYLMDDDFRLSFMHGNYVTLTNLKDGELDRICLFHSAFFQRVAVRIEHHRAHRLVIANDLGEPRFAGKAHKRQTGEFDATVETDELEMADQFVFVFIQNLVRARQRHPLAIAHLQISDRGVDAQRA